MDTQLSRACPERSEGFRRSMTARPCRSPLVPFDSTISSERVAPRGCSRLVLRAPLRSRSAQRLTRHVRRGVIDETYDEHSRQIS
jgi:hypothetical protein